MKVAEIGWINDFLMNYPMARNFSIDRRYRALVNVAKDINAGVYEQYGLTKEMLCINEKPNNKDITTNLKALYMIELNMMSVKVLKED